MRKKILLLATGGTIASLLSDHGLKPGLNAEQILSFIPEIKEECDVDALQVCNIDSTNMSPEVWKQIVCAIEAKYLYYDGFVVCHGTDTMAYTSAALSYMIQNSNKPIVITGSQKPISEDSTDARLNLLDSIRYAADDASMGVVLVFNGNVIAGTRAKKTYAHSYNAFSSVNFPVLAVIRDRRIIRFISQLPFTEPVRFGHRLDDSIVVLKLIPGTRPELVEYLFAHYDCLVIESFGVGGIPDNLREVFYQVGQQVKQDFHLMEAYDMTLEATITKLMYLMGTYGGDYVSVCDGFYKTINYDILMPSMQQR